MISRKFYPILAALAFLFVLSPARADLQIDITRGVTDPIPIAIVPFARAVPADGGVDVAGVIQRDLESSGRFKGMERRDMISQPTRAADVQTADWRTARNDYIVVGRIVSQNATDLVLEFDLLNLLTGQTLTTQKVTVAQRSLRYGAHRVADIVYERITGTRGAFATRIAYVSVDGSPPNQRYQLFVADTDGENMNKILESSQPIMSPAWSPDGQWMAYVSFENRVSAIFLQRMSTGERRQISQRAGINGSPAFSPDGKRIALTLSGSSGNLDIYLLDLGTQQLTRVTDDPAIDTEAVWSPDGKYLYFTSDRGGAPQIYRVEAQPNAKPRRITFGVAYAARPRLSPDGTQLAMVVQENGGFRIAMHDLASQQTRALSRGSLDESPSFAPNGAQLIYAGRDRGQGVLAMVSVDGQITQRLKSDQGEVREPVWGPFTN